jgi:heme A synthase
MFSAACLAWTLRFLAGGVMVAVVACLGFFMKEGRQREAASSYYFFLAAKIDLLT